MAELWPDLPVARRPQPGDLQQHQDGPVTGEVRGDLATVQAASAGIDVWCGDAHGWRPLDSLITSTSLPVVLVQQNGRLSAGLLFDLGPSKRQQS